ncbi:peptidoglycan-associated lipoprotein Pal [Vibrio comitans]|uniref:Peptidoglycan-associated lipoprotein n=1 Tax=Vibrio comitans NBRC 102076 TaxID=1219078 RepID=A0A4Y3IQT7_9VIBR|nr:peptidoglycan-associated lipoprotein Pal [Vibrio comitans]GEA61899.1 peptidoglycan-associated lipoprotein [Vibrio comitans NBRC 102076]
MQLNKVFKGLLIALPVLAVTACSSTDEATDASDAQTTNQEAQANATETTDTTVVSPMTEEEKLAEEREMAEKALRENTTLYFPFDNSTISSEYEEMLSAHALFLSENPDVKVTIEGHADERGTPEYNIALGERRANAVSNYLQASGVQADQLSIVSYGEEKPLELGQSEEAYAKNRRAVLVY